MGSPEVEKKTWTVGTLTYTKMGLLVLFCWLLWGDFCFTLMERLRPAIMPLFLMGKAGGIEASNKVVYAMMVVIPGITGLFIGPAVSFKSDRHRSRKGRRIPYITWTTPFLVMGLIGMGCAPMFRDFFAKTDGFLGLPPHSLTLLTIGFFVVMFHFFDEFVNSVFWYLFADVVPEHLLGRFLALFRLVGTGAGAAFSWWVFPHAETHMPHIFFGISMVYLFGFTVMCWRVKEGEYPPPDDLGEKPSVLKQVKIYLSECFSHPVYVFMFLYTALFYSANVVAFGTIIFTRDGIGLTMEQIGKIGAIVAIVTMIFQYPSGWLVDKFHAVRVTFVTLVLMIPIDFFAFFYLRDLNTYIIFSGIKLVIFGLNGAAGMPLHVLIFPRDKFGQFASCNGMMRSTSLMLTGIFGAMFMDYFTDNSANKFEFRWMFIWMAVCQALAAIALFTVYGIWKKRGGAKGYVPPGSLREKEMLAAAAAAAAGEATDSAANGNDAAE